MSTKRVRISAEEAAYIGVHVNHLKPSANSSVPYRIHLNEDQLSQLSQFRHKGLVHHAKARGIDFDSVIEYWDKTKEYSVRVRPEVIQVKGIATDLLNEMKEYAPQYPTIFRTQSKEAHLLVIDPADVHIGKLATSFESGEDYNSEIAVQRVLVGVQGILDKSAGWAIEKIALIIGNDILHIDTPKRTTTSGTPQDTDGMWYENFLKAKKLYVDVIEMLVTIADVHVMYNPSNHDYTNGFFLADVIKTWFNNSKNVTFDTSISHRKYMLYGKNLIGTTHGDGAKANDLPLLMAVEAKNEWSLSKHRYLYTHHVHHKSSKDYIGVTVESLRSPSGTDSWHHRKGYQHAPKAVEGFIHHPIHGQVCRLTHLF
jgi:hypothetical protein